MRQRLILLALAILSIVFVMSLLPSFLENSGMNLPFKNQSPSFDHWFGTDELGRDLFLRVCMGARVSLFVGIVAACIDVVIGILWGGTAGYFGGHTDLVMMRIADVLYAIPNLLVIILFTVIFEPGMFTIVLAMIVLGWITMARIVRGEVLKLKESEYVMAAYALGATHRHIFLKHLLPNAMGPIMVTMTFTVPVAIFTEAFLSYLGLGIQAPAASWGTLANEGLPALQFYPWRIFFPALLIVLTIFAFNVIGDGLKKTLVEK